MHDLFDKNDALDYFPDCTCHDVDQRTDQWHELRRDKLTASDFGMWLAESPTVNLTVAEICAILEEEGIDYPKRPKRDVVLDLLPNPKQYAALSDTVQAAQHTAVCQVLARQSGVEMPPEWDIDPAGPPPKNPAAWAIWRGTVMEAEARDFFVDRTGLPVFEVGFCEHKSGSAGCSPDGGIVNASEGLEIKCPNPNIHIKYLLSGELPREYIPQVHGSMAVTGADAWHFLSYCPGLPAMILRIERDDLTTRFEEGLWRFSEELGRCRKLMAELWREEYA